MPVTFIAHERDGDYIVYGQQWVSTRDWEPFIEVISRWLIPGTELED